MDNHYSPIQYFINLDSESELIYHKFLKDKKFKTIYEPFGGSCSFTIFSIKNELSEHYVVNDSYEMLMDGLETMMDEPAKVIDSYQRHFFLLNQCKNIEQKYFYYEKIKNQLNNLEKKSVKEFDLLFLNNFTKYHLPLIQENSYKSHFYPLITERNDPVTIQESIKSFATLLLKYSVAINKGCFTKLLKNTDKNDLVFLDPPYPDLPEDIPIYHRPDDKNAMHHKLTEQIAVLNKKKTAFIVFYGWFGVNEKFLLDEKKLDLQHWVLYKVKQNSLSTELLEHCYVSRNLASDCYNIFQQNNMLLIPYDFIKDKPVIDALFYARLNKKESVEESDKVSDAKFILIDGKRISITPRESEVIHHLLMGNSAKQTAWALNLSVRTVEAYLSNIKKKSGCRTKVSLISKLNI